MVKRFTLLDLLAGAAEVSRIIELVLPPGGWHYKDSVHGYRVPHTGEAPTPKILEDMLQEYRLENQLPVGDIIQDIENYICSNFPRNCTVGDQPPLTIAQTQQAPSQTRFVDLISGWANTLYQRQDKRLIPIAEVEQRSQACLRCPLNQVWENDCPQCVTNAQRVLSIIRQGKESSQWRRLHGCRAQGFCTRTAIHLEREFLGAVAEGVPDYCWMK